MMTEVHWTTAGAGTTRPPDAWWQALAQRGCFPERGRRVIVHVAASTRNPIVVDTARALVDVLRRTGTVGVAILDPGGSDAWTGIDRIDPGPRLRVDAPCLRDGAHVPTLWLEDFSLVTVTGAAPDPRYGIAAILAAQAGLLADPGADDLGAIFEAHRLLAADLSIACGTVTHDTLQSESWWAAGTDDVALELDVAEAAGAHADDLPAIVYLARHETLPNRTRPSRRHVTLANHVAPAEVVRKARRAAEARRLARMIREDLSLAAANLYRIPQFIDRRWPGLLSFGRRAA